MIYVFFFQRFFISPDNICVSEGVFISQLNFTLSPNNILNNPQDYIKIVKERFLDTGWDSDGEIELMWIPPFMLRKAKIEDLYKGITVWHVKQVEDGLSWILSPIELPI